VLLLTGRAFPFTVDHEMTVRPLAASVGWLVSSAIAFAFQGATLEAAANAPPTGAPASAAKPKPALSIIGDAGARTVRFDGADANGRTAKLTLLLKLENHAGGALTVSFFPTAASSSRTQAIPLNQPKKGAYPRVQPRVAVAGGGEPSVEPGTNILRLVFGLRKGAAPEAADGLLQLVVKDVPPAQVAVVGAAPKASVAPSPVTLKVTRGVDFPLVGGWGPSGDEETVRIAGPGAAGMVAHPDVRAVLVGESEANAALRFSSPSGNGTERTGTVTVSGWSGEGTYKGSLDLDRNSASATSIPVDVKVRDSILWPLFFVLLGALLGGLGVRAYGVHKRRDLLRSELKATNELYDAEADKSHPYTLDDDLVGGIREPTKRQCKQPGTITGEIGQLYCAIHTAKTDPEFAIVTARTRAVMARFANWHDLRRELARLNAALEFAGPGAGTSIRSDTEELARRVGSEPPADQAPGIVAGFREQRQVLRAYKRLADRFNALSPADRRRLARYQPDSLYDDAPPAELGGSGRVWPTLNLFDSATDALADPASAPPIPPGAPPEDEHEGIRDRLRRTRTLGFDAITYIDAPRADRRSSREILAGLRRWDWTLGIATAALTVLAYVVGIYTDTYGGWVAYATAFAAGFFAQATLAAVATAISQLPLFQSYRLGPGEPAK
jgi:hypothetical protein